MLTGCGGNPVATTSLPQQENSLLSSTPTPTPSLVSKPVKGFIYGYNTITEGGESISNISVLDIPAVNPDSSGNVPLINQFSDYLKQEYPQDWNTPDIQELNSRLSESLSQYKPLGEYDASAKVFSVYQDSQEDTPLSVNTEGQIEGNILTNEQDSTVKLEVTLGEDEIAETETISSSDTISSSADSGAVLKSCPEKIITLPDEIVIFKIFSEPSIDLKKAGLKFSLNNNSIGCIAPPVYLCIFGKHKYNEAYGFIYIKKNPDTPVDCVISATTSTGLSLNIPLSVVKRTGIISGRVYSGEKPLIKGYVKSIGPKAHCKLDSEGRYNLPAVFLGHERSVIATWWTMDGNGKKVKHREERIIDFFSQDVSGFVFGVPPTPTPTSTPSATPTMRPPMDPFYTQITTKVTKQYGQWEKELGTEQAIQKTVDWLNDGNDPNNPPKPEFINKALMDNNNGSMFWVVFSDGWTVFINTEPSNTKLASNINTISPKSFSTHIEKNNKKLKCANSLPLHTSAAQTSKTSDILILCPILYEYFYTQQVDDTTDYPFSVYGRIAQDLHNCGYNVTRIMCDYPDAHHPDTFGNAVAEEDQIVYDEIHNPDNSVSPEDFEKNVSKCGVIFIFTRGEKGGWLDCGAIFKDDERKGDWISEHWEEKIVINKDEEFPPIREGDIWAYGYSKEKRHKSDQYPDPHPFIEFYDTYVPHLYLTYHFFERLDFKNSIVYLQSSYSYEDNLVHAFRKTCGTFVGYDYKIDPQWADMVSYFFFRYMMYGFDSQPVLLENHRVVRADEITPYKPIYRIIDPPPGESPPMSALQALIKLNELGLIVDTSDYYDFHGEIIARQCKVLIDTRDDMYFPIPVEVTIDKNLH